MRTYHHVETEKMLVGQLSDVRVLRMPETSGGNVNYGWKALENLAGEWQHIFE
jgi:hypothetical protein